MDSGVCNWGSKQLDLISRSTPLKVEYEVPWRIWKSLNRSHTLSGVFLSLLSSPRLFCSVVFFLVFVFLLVCLDQVEGM